LPGGKEEEVADSGVDFAAVKPGRFVDRAQESEVVHSRDEILAAVDRLGEAREAGALADKIRAHGEDNEEAERRTVKVGDRVKDLNEEASLFAALFLAITKQLLELIDKEAEAGTFLCLKRPVDIGKSRAAKGEAIVPSGGGLRRRAGRAGQRAERLGKGAADVAQWSTTRAGDSSLPGLDATGVVEAKPGQDRCADEGRLATAGSAVDDNEVLFRKADDYLVSYRLAAEEDGPLGGLERT
jgi:hypothetical protein